MSDAPTRTWTPLDARERRVLGVLIEKQKTTPDAYPMSLLALVTGCNQKSNREPITNYDQDDVEETLDRLRPKGAVVLYEGSGRVPRWKHNAYEWFGLKGRPVEAAILAELLLRGPQTEGELRQRASRMDPIPDLPALQTSLNYLGELGLVVVLSPHGQRRGVTISHNLYPPDELERVRANVGRMLHAEAEAEARGETPVRGGVPSGELAVLRGELDSLRGRVDELEADVRRLKQALGG